MAKKPTKSDRLSKMEESVKKIKDKNTKKRIDKRAGKVKKSASNALDDAKSKPKTKLSPGDKAKIRNNAGKLGADAKAKVGKLKTGVRFGKGIKSVFSAANVLKGVAAITPMGAAATVATVMPSVIDSLTKPGAVFGRNKDGTSNMQKQKAHTTSFASDMDLPAGTATRKVDKTPKRANMLNPEYGRPGDAILTRGANAAIATPDTRRKASPSNAPQRSKAPKVAEVKDPSKNKEGQSAKKITAEKSSEIKTQAAKIFSPETPKKKPVEKVNTVVAAVSKKLNSNETGVKSDGAALRKVANPSNSPKRTKAKAEKKKVESKTWKRQGKTVRKGLAKQGGR